MGIEVAADNGEVSYDGVANDIDNELGNDNGNDPIGALPTIDDDDDNDEPTTTEATLSSSPSLIDIGDDGAGDGEADTDGTVDDDDARGLLLVLFVLLSITSLIISNQSI
jgi:hypothetical protein